MTEGQGQGNSELIYKIIGDHRWKEHGAGLASEVIITKSKEY